ncbi:MAG: hypothetical protein QOE26_3263 [Verrucomicrobiota bacterium]
MIAYIKRIADEIAGLQGAGKAFELLRVLPSELDRLDTRDFLPAGRYDFVLLRARAHSWGRITTISTEMPQIRSFGKSISTCLDLYGGEGSRAISRLFAFVSDAGLRNIIERDYRELSLILLPGGAWKSVVVMSGSILEAILYDQLTKDASTQARAVTASSAPRRKDISRGEWRLHDLIQVAVELTILPASRAQSIDQILRDYRNFVHPKKELRSAHPCSEAEALLSKGALDSVCNHLTP